MKYSAKEIQRILDENRGPEVYTLNTVVPEETDEYKEYQRYLRFYECKKVKKQLRANPDLIVNYILENYNKIGLDNYIDNLISALPTDSLIKFKIVDCLIK